MPVENALGLGGVRGFGTAHGADQGIAPLLTRQPIGVAWRPVRGCTGYSDDVSVSLNDNIPYRGRSAQNFRDTGFLGIVSPENDAIYLPLKKGRNELLLAVSELGGGWGFICRWDPER